MLASVASINTHAFDRDHTMHRTPTLATRFGRNTHVIRSEHPLAGDQMRKAAPSIFAAGKHASRSEQYTYIPTIDVLHGLQREGFEAFMAAQSVSKIEGKTEFTKYIIRMRHVRDRAGQLTTKPGANEIIVINSHDGASSYQLLEYCRRKWLFAEQIATWPAACISANPGYSLIRRDN